MKILDRMTNGERRTRATVPELEALELFSDLHNRVCHGEPLDDDEEKAELREAWSVISDKPFPADEVELIEAVESVEADSEVEIPF